MSRTATALRRATAASRTDQPKLVPLGEAALYLGSRKVMEVLELARAGSLPSTRVAGRYWFSLDQLDAFRASEEVR